MKSRLLWIVGMLCAASLLGCGRAEKPPFIVYCGAGLRPPVAEIIDTFEKLENVNVEPIYTGSGLLLAQITLGRKGDIYIPGDQFFMKQAEDKGFITRQVNAAWWIPVIGVQKGNPKKIAGLADLAREDLKVGLGEAKSCAIGRSSAVMLERAGLADKVKPHVTTATVNELGNYLKLGTLDAAIIWDAVAKFYPQEVDAIPIDPAVREVCSVPVGVLKFTSHPALADAFLEFIAGDEGKAIFRKHGYTLTLDEKESGR